MKRTATMDRAKKSRLRRKRSSAAEPQPSSPQPSSPQPSSPQPSSPQPSESTAKADTRPAASWHTFLLAGTSLALLWAALPPLSWWPLAWLAPLPLLWLIQAPRMPGRRPHWAIWTAAFLHWLAVMQGVRLAHPALYGGWLALSWYLAFYPLLFVVIARIAVHKARVPLTLAAPIAWVGLELLRGHAITGFSAALLGHTQYTRTMLIQVSDLVGGYGVSFLVMLVAAALCSGLPWRKWWPAMISHSTVDVPPSNPVGTTFQPLPLLAAGVLLSGTLAYGYYRLAEHEALIASRSEKGADLHVALLQESVDTVFEYNPQRNQETFDRYLTLAESAVAQRPQTDVIVWPESMFNANQSVYLYSADAIPPAELGWTPEQFDMHKLRSTQASQVKAQGAAYRLGNQAAMLVGTDVYLLGEQQEHFNSAALYSSEGKLLDRYGKMHRVMFGEYIPFGDLFPLLYKLTPMRSGLTPGPQPEAFQLQGVQLAPSICFESVMPHLIRSQVKELDARGDTPDVLVNITNDGWFHGSSILDLHHICSVFRAVENRRPMLVAANIGITAEIDATGTVVQKLPRRAADVLHVELYRSEQPLSSYTQWGDWAAWLCLLCCGAMVVWGVIGRKKDNTA